MKIPIPTEEALEFERRGLLEPDLEEGGYKLTPIRGTRQSCTAETFLISGRTLMPCVWKNFGAVKER